MRARIEKLWANQLVKGTTIFFIGSMAVNFGGFLFHLIISRELGPVEYGILGSLFGLMYFTGIPTGAIDLVITKTVSEFPDTDRLSYSKSFLRYLYKKFNKLLFLSVPVAILISWPIQHYLHLEHVYSVFSVWLVVYSLFVSTILSAVLKGLLEFVKVSISQSVAIFLRIIIAVVLVMYFVTNHMGAQIGIVLSSLVGVVLMLWQLKPVLQAKVNTKLTSFNLKQLGFSSFALSAVFTSMYSLDIIMVKHYLPAFDAGLYAVLATAGKIVLFATAPIIAAILPVVARKSKNPETARNDLYFVVVVISLISLAVVTLYYLLPRFIITLIFTTKFIDAAPYLMLVGIAMAFYSLANALSAFLISIGKINVYRFGLMAVISEILLIFLFHDSIIHVITTLIWVFGILAGSLLIYSLHVTRKKRFSFDHNSSLS